MASRSFDRSFERSRTRCPDFAAILGKTTPDPVLYEQIARCFYEELSAVAESACGDRSAADDALQQAMLWSMENLPSFVKGNQSLRDWLSRLVDAACMRMSAVSDPGMQAQFRPGRFEGGADGPDVTAAEAGEAQAETEDPELNAMVDERIGLLSSVLSELNEDDGSMLLLHEGQGVSCKTLARRFGIQEEAVYRRLESARHRVKTLLIERAGDGKDTGS